MKKFNEHKASGFILEEISEMDEQAWNKCLHRSKKHMSKLKRTRTKPWEQH